MQNKLQPKFSIKKDTLLLDKVSLLGGSNIEKFLQNITNVTTNLLEEKTYDILSPIVLGNLCVVHNGNPVEITICIPPLQDFTNSDIIQNIAVNKSTNILTIQAKIPNNICTQEDIFKLINNNITLSNKIISSYCQIQDRILNWAIGQKDMLTQRHATSQEVYNVLMTKFPPTSGFTGNVLQFPNLTSTNVKNYNHSGVEMLSTKEIDYFSKKILTIEERLKGPQNMEKLQSFIQQVSTTEQSIKKDIISPIEAGSKTIQIDTKYMYMDNGHQLYKDVLYQSKYNEYYKTEIALLQQKRVLLQSFLKTKYWGLGVGDGQKDFTLLQDAKNLGFSIMIDSSLKSLEEAEVNCTGNKNGNRGLYGLPDIVFSQDRIDKLLTDKKMRMLFSTFGTQHSTEGGMPEVRETTNTFGILGGTFGNFDQGYKTQFLKDMYKIMNTGDTLLISVFNKPKTQEDIQDIVSHYNTPFVHAWIKNFFIKLGIKEEKIEIKVDYKNNAITIDALICEDTRILFKDTYTNLPQGTLFTCFQSQRIDRADMENIITKSTKKYAIKDAVSIEGNPFTIYVLEKV